MIVMITGATSGFGEEMARRFIADGHKVIGTGRRENRLKTISDELGSLFYPLLFDVTDHDGTQRAILELPSSWSDIDVLVNNAGLALGLEPVHKADFYDWDRMISTNITGLAFITRIIVEEMVKKDKGHIVNIGSVAGTYPYPGGNVYGATKAFVKQFSLNLRADLTGTRVRVTNIEPGLCGGTEFSGVRFKGDLNKAETVYKGVDYIKPEDIAETVLWCVNQPTRININNVELMPVDQSFGALTLSRR
ncbi:SDR family oxidoreductase [Oceanimonas smirnovii]|uniref:SDR family oxidoreductase n=1 Tax=Oceanimonas smirnovii TaxID=264574 RepID=UPI000475841C|nr:SDR family oxidoreductase [Oceanimonas smirnovii]